MLQFFKNIVLFSSIINVLFFIVPPFYGFISFSIFYFRMLFYFEFLNVDSWSLWIVSSCVLLWDYLYWGFFAFASTSCFREITNLISVKFCSVAQLCQTLCDPIDCSMPGLPVHHQLPDFTQTHVHWVGDAIQPSHPLSSPSPPAFKLSQH